MSDNSLKIYQSFVTFLEQYYKTRVPFQEIFPRELFYNRCAYKGIYLYNLDENNYMIGFSLNYNHHMITSDFRLLMQKKYDQMNSQLFDNSIEVMFSKKESYLVIYLHSKTTFMDIFRFLSLDHPMHYVFLVDGLQGWNELNEELIHHETFLLRNSNLKRYELHNIPNCNNLSLNFHDGIGLDLSGLQNIKFEIINICYMFHEPNFLLKKSYPLIEHLRQLPLNYNCMKIHTNSLTIWDKYYEENLITDEFINKITSLRISYNKEISNSIFLNKLLTSKSLTELIFNLQIQTVDDIHLLDSFLTNEYLKKVVLKINVINPTCISKHINTYVSDSIQYLRITYISKIQLPYTLYFSSTSSLEFIKTDFHIEAHQELFNQLKYVYITNDNAIFSIARILNVKPENIADSLCKRINIRVIHIKSKQFDICQPDLNNYFGILIFVLHRANHPKFDGDSIKNVQHNKIRVKSLLQYAK